MKRTAQLQTAVLIGIAALFGFGAPYVLAENELREERYPFLQLEVGNQPDRNVCLGLAGAIACLEEATETDGEASLEKLAELIWKNLHDPKHKLRYSQFSLLRDGTRVRTCSKAAIQELAILLQAKYEHTVSKELWQTGIEPDRDTAAGRALLETREKYLASFRKRVTSRSELKLLIERDEDGLVALAGQGVREFQNGPPQKIIDKYNIAIDPETQTYLPVPTAHVFLITYDKNDDEFYVYDSNDADRRWLALVHGNGAGFVVDWRIHDHMGHGPCRQMYFEIKPLPELLACFRRILKDHNGARDNRP